MLHVFLHHPLRMCVVVSLAKYKSLPSLAGHQITEFYDCYWLNFNHDFPVNLVIPAHLKRIPIWLHRHTTIRSTFLFPAHLKTLKLCYTGTPLLNFAPPLFCYRQTKTIKLNG